MELQFKGMNRLWCEKMKTAHAPNDFMIWPLKNRDGTYSFKIDISYGQVLLYRHEKDLHTPDQYLQLEEEVSEIVKLIQKYKLGLI